MNLQKPIVKYITLVLLCVLAALVLILFPLFLTKELDRQNQEFLTQLSSKNAEAIGFKFEDQTSFFYELADRIDTKHYESPKEAVKSIGKIRTQLAYQYYGVALADGNAYGSNGKSFILTTKKIINDSIEKGELVVERITQKGESEDYFLMVMPLIKDGKSNSILFLKFNETDVKHNFMSTAFDSSETFFIVDKNGNNIMNTEHNGSSEYIPNLFSSKMYESKYKGSRIDKIKEDMENGKTGVMLSTRGTVFYMYYAPLHFNDWYLFSLIPASQVNSIRNTVILYVILLCIIMIIVFALFVVYIISSERAKKENLDKLLYKDSLTGGASYAKFCIDVKTQLVKSKKKFAYIVMDLDSFKLINSYYGYEKGDDIINYIYSLWCEILTNGEYVSRTGADTFAVFMKYNDKDDVIKRIEHFCNECISHSNEFMSDYIITPSIGIYYLQNDDMNIPQIQNHALMAKSTVKGDHDKLYSVYNDELKEQLTSRKIMEDNLTHAIKDDSLEVYFQPQFYANDKTLCGAEALIRWRDKDGAFINPECFIHLAEEKGIIKDLDKYVFEKVCDAQVEMAKAGLPPIDISINVSQQSLYDKDFIKKYLEIIKEKHADINHLQLEITESSLFDNRNAFIKILKNLRKEGFKILMDDFGTGYSSLMMLKYMPIDYLKLDKTFIDEYNSQRGNAIIDCVITMAKRLKIIIIAEGVETEEQFQYIKNAKCDIIQGYYFSKAISLDALEKMIKNYKDKD